MQRRTVPAALIALLIGFSLLTIAWPPATRATGSTDFSAFLDCPSNLMFSAPPSMQKSCAPQTPPGGSEQFQGTYAGPGLTTGSSVMVEFDVYGQGSLAMYWQLMDYTTGQSLAQGNIQPTPLSGTDCAGAGTVSGTATAPSGKTINPGDALGLFVDFTFVSSTGTATMCSGGPISNPSGLQLASSMASGSGTSTSSSTASSASSTSSTTTSTTRSSSTSAASQMQSMVSTQSSSTGAVANTSGGGIPWWVIALALAGVAAIVIFWLWWEEYFDDDDEEPPPSAGSGGGSTKIYEDPCKDARKEYDEASAAEADAKKKLADAQQKERDARAMGAPVDESVTDGLDAEYDRAKKKTAQKKQAYDDCRKKLPNGYH